MSKKLSRDSYFDTMPFLKGSDIKGGEVATIEKFEEIQTRISKKPRPCLRLKGYEAPLGLNATNFGRMVEKFGDDADKWAGKKITLARVMVHNPQEKKETPAVRIA